MTNNVFIIRHESGLKQFELAKLVQISVTTMSLIERGKTSPNIDIALRIAKVLETDINELFKLEL